MYTDTFTARGISALLAFASPSLNVLLKMGNVTLGSQACIIWIERIRCGIDFVSFIARRKAVFTSLWWMEVHGLHVFTERYNIVAMIFHDVRQHILTAEKLHIIIQRFKRAIENFAAFENVNVVGSLPHIGNAAGCRVRSWENVKGLVERTSLQLVHVANGHIRVVVRQDLIAIPKLMAHEQKRKTIEQHICVVDNVVQIGW